MYGTSTNTESIEKACIHRVIGERGSVYRGWERVIVYTEVSGRVIVYTEGSGRLRLTVDEFPVAALEPAVSH